MSSHVKSSVLWTFQDSLVTVIVDSLLHMSSLDRIDPLNKDIETNRPVKEQSDQGLHCLPFHNYLIHIFSAYKII